MTKSKDQLTVFRWIDALTFGLAAVLSDAILAYFIVNGKNLNAEAIALMIVVGLTMWVPYGVILLVRAKWLRSITFVTKHGLPVITNGFPVKQEDVETITEQTLSLWDSVIGHGKSLKSIEDLFVYFKEYPVKHPNVRGQTFAGLLLGKNAVIGYKDKLEETAIAHELGHEIHRDLVGYYDNEECHSFMAEHKLP